jgi:hypothetical protein
MEKERCPMRNLIIAAAISFTMFCFGTARADNPAPSDDEGFAIGSGPGHSWVGYPVYTVGETNYDWGNTLATDPNYSPVPANQHFDYYRPTDYQFNIVNPAGGQSTQYFETPPPNATVTPYGGSPVACTETLFNSNRQMEIHLATEFVYVNGYSEESSLPFGVGDWIGWSVTGSPTFVLQMQAYNAYGNQLYNEDVEFVSSSQSWVGRGSVSGPLSYIDAAPAGSFGPRGWEADSPLTSPVPVPGAAVLGIVGIGLLGWVKRRVG